jgi:hypothetical protein
MSSIAELAALAQELRILKKLLERTHETRQRLLIQRKAWELMGRAAAGRGEGKNGE